MKLIFIKIINVLSIRKNCSSVFKYSTSQKNDCFKNLQIIFTSILQIFYTYLFHSDDFCVSPLSLITQLYENLKAFDQFAINGRKFSQREIYLTYQISFITLDINHRSDKINPSF